jgi:prepilin-type N-terminal cleavage/methylation domain-containing protein
MPAAGKPFRAFSLIELVTALAIASIVMAIAAPRFANSLSRNHAQNAAQRIVADLALAQRLARTTSLGQTVVFTVASNSYSLSGVTGLAGPSSSYTVLLSNDPYESTLASAVFGATSSITYDRFGQPSSGGTIIVQCGAWQKTITVDPNSGLASFQ